MVLALGTVFSTTFSWIVNTWPLTHNLGKMLQNRLYRDLFCMLYSCCQQARNCLQNRKVSRVTFTVLIQKIYHRPDVSGSSACSWGNDWIIPQTHQGLKGALALAAETAACLPCQVGKTIALLRGKGRPTIHTTPAKISSNAPPAIWNNTQYVCIWHMVVESVSVNTGLHWTEIELNHLRSLKKKKPQLFFLGMILIFYC